MQNENFTFVSDTKAAEILGLKAQTLRNWRYLRRGPVYHKIGGRAVRYAIKDLEQFKEKHRIDPEKAA